MHGGRGEPHVDAAGAVRKRIGKAQASADGLAGYGEIFARFWCAYVHMCVPVCACLRDDVWFAKAWSVFVVENTIESRNHALSYVLRCCSLCFSEWNNSERTGPRREALVQDSHRTPKKPHPCSLRAMRAAKHTDFQSHTSGAVSSRSWLFISIRRGSARSLHVGVAFAWCMAGGSRVAAGAVRGTESPSRRS